MKKKSYFLKVLLIVTTLIAFISAIIIFYLKETTTAQTHGVLHLKGLQGPVYVLRDHEGVPHIYAQVSDQDAFFALGFVQAQDRFWQMEFQRHVAAGTLSEIFGKKTIEQDKLLRTWGFYRSTQQAWPIFDEQSKAIVMHFTAGINAFIDQKHYPLQMLLIGDHPRPWTVYDSMSSPKIMAFDLQTSWHAKIKNWLVSQDEGTNKIDTFFPSYPENGPTTLSSQDLALAGLLKKTDPLTETSTYLSSKARSAVKTLMKDYDHLSAKLSQSNCPGKGSNAWVVSGRWTKNGHALLADDIHLTLTAPNIWYLVDLHAPHFHTTGASFPGVPGVIAGRNDHIAWSLTNGANDPEDLFIIKSNKRIHTINEVINVKNGTPINFPIEISDHGPVISNVTPEMKDVGLKLAIQWPTLEPHDTTLEAFLHLQYAHNWHDFTEALKLYIAPTQNFLYADVKGNIGYYYPGKLPIRDNYSGAFPVDEDHRWLGFIPFEKLPHSFNPPEGYIVSANNKVVPDSYPYMLTFYWHEPPFRAARIQQLILTSGKLDAQKFMTFQQDTLSNYWLTMKPILMKTTPLDEPSNEALAILNTWDGRCDLDSKGSTIFAYWLKQLSVLLPQKLAFGDKWLPPLFLENTLKQPAQAVFLSQSLSLAANALIHDHGTNTNHWEWRHVHHGQFDEMGLGESKWLNWIWAKRPSTPGGDYTVDVGTYDFKNFNQIVGAVYRHVIDLGNPTENYFVLPLGESENVFSKYFTNWMQKWIHGGYVAMHPKINIPCDPQQKNCLLLLPE